MRILMLAQFYPPAVGGEERFTCDLSVALAARGHDVSVATLWHEGYPEFEIDRGVRIYRLRGTMQQLSILFSESDHRYAPPFPDPGLMRELRRVILAEKPDIVHAHNWLLHSFTPLKTWSKARFVVSLHDYSLICAQKRLMRHNKPCTGPQLAQCLECSVDYYGIAKGPVTTLANFYWGGRERQAVDMFLPVSQVVVEKTQLDKYRVPYRIMPNFVPDTVETLSDETDPFLAQLPKGDFLLFVGDVSQDKGAEVLLQAYSAMDTQIPLVLIGRKFLDLKEQLPPNVFPLGVWPHNAVMGAWSRSSLGLVPSIVAETFGIVALEAMYAGKAVIATRNGGLTDVVVDGETGLLVPPGDPQALREAIQSLLNDRARLDHMGRMAKQRVAAFQAKVVVPRFEQVYQELLAVDLSDAHTLVQTGSR
jgi:glycosyltransferase involved in cell wall biosynthesis